MRSQATSQGRSAQQSKVRQEREFEVRAQDASEVSVAAQLRCARWPISPVVFHALEALVAGAAAVCASAVFSPVLTAVAGLAGLMVCRKALAWATERRTEAFNADFPQFLLATVGLLKTGMNPIAALSSAASGLDEGSLVREEVELLVDRLRYGAAEDASIGEFAVDILNPEIELFVQALILSRRVGGTLSDTLERIAKQVRRRRQFREQARAAVSMQRGSVYIIVVIMTLLFVYLLWANPEMANNLRHYSQARLAAECGVAAVFGAIVWVERMTKIKT